MGRVVNLVGDSSSGKTLLAIEAAANFHREYPKGDILYVEAEAAFDRDYAESVGFPDDAFMPNEENPEIITIEEFFDALGKFLKDRKQPGLVILDSLDSLTDKEELEKGATEGSYGVRKAAVFSKQMRKYMQVIGKSNSMLLIISQTRDKIGVTFGEKKTRSGGKALRFYASQELWLSCKSKIHRTVDGERRVQGVTILAKTKKNRFAPAPREVELDLKYAYGIDDLTSCAGYLGKSVRGVDKWDAQKYHKTVEEMIPQVQKKWEDIEAKFKPVRRKYG